VRSMFRSAILKLTAFYLFILLLVSVFFSLNLYRISTAEINMRLQRQIADIDRDDPFGVYVPRDQNLLEQKRLQGLEASKDVIAAQLLYANIVILIAGGLGSYFLARRTLRPIEEAHAAQSRFAADASHELRTPLAVMQTETEVTLRDPKLTLAEAREQLKSNLEELERLTQLSDGLLQLARGADTTINDDTVQLGTIIRDAVKQRTAQAEAKDITIAVTAVPKVALQTNRTQITQVITILLDNAIKYGDKGSAITVTSAVHNQHVTIQVQDTGNGMDKTELGQIFDRFYRADSARSSATVPGNGLGLAIARQIMTAHHGKITATSTPGEGSTFTIVLPVN
jgi:two-component system, OmpR family, sensor histidine kinase CiaH